MENFETARIKALGRVKLLTVVLFLLILIGGYIEWQRVNKPLDEAIVVYKITDKAAVDNKPDNVGNLPVAEKKKGVAIENKDSNGANAKNLDVKNNDIVGEFLKDIDLINAKLDEVKKPNSALDNIIPLEVKENVKKDEIIFEDGKIEIFNDKNEKVAVESVPVVESNKKESIVNDDVEKTKEVSNDEGFEVTLEEVNASNGMESEEVKNNDNIVEQEDKSESVEIKEVKSAEQQKYVNEDKKMEGESEDNAVNEVKDDIAKDDTKDMAEADSEQVLDEADDIEKEVVSEQKIDIEPKVNDVVDENVLAEDKAKEEILNISVDDVEQSNDVNNKENVEYEENFNNVKMRINENGISFVGEDGVEIKIDENGILIDNPDGESIKVKENGGIIREVVDGESGEVVVDEVEAIVNTEEKTFEVKALEDNDAPINLLKGIAESK